MRRKLSGSPLIRQVSVHTIVGLMLRQGEISRAEIAEVTGLSKQTASVVVAALEEAGWVQPTGHRRKALGRSAIAYQIKAAAAHVLAVDLGGTKLRVAIANLRGEIVVERTVPTDQRGGIIVVEQIGSTYSWLLANSTIDATSIRFAVIGAPGVFDRSTGKIERAPNIAGFGKLSVQLLLAEMLNMPVIIENDVNLAVLAEQWQGMKQDNMIFVALGTGLGMGVLMDGVLMRGAHGGAGEIGDMPVGPEAFEAGGPAGGQLEQAVASAAIARRYEALGGPKGLTVKEIFDQHSLGDQMAGSAVTDTARVLAHALASIVAILDPACIVLGGSIGMRNEFVDEVRRSLREELGHEIDATPSRFGDRASIIGAVAVALSHLYGALFGVSDLPDSVPRPAFNLPTPKRSDDESVLIG